MNLSTTPIPEWLSDALLTAGDLVAFHNLVPAALFVLYYRMSPWKNNFVGRALMLLGISLVITQVVLSLSLFLGPDYFGREFVRLIGYIPAGISLWVVFRALRGAQTAEEHEDLSFTEDTIGRKRRARKDGKRASRR